METLVDSPLHFLAEGTDIAGMPVTTFFGSAVVVDTPKKLGEDIYPTDFAYVDIRHDDIVLVSTGWGARINPDRLYEDSWPGFTVEAISTTARLAGSDEKASWEWADGSPQRASPAAARSLIWADTFRLAADYAFLVNGKVTWDVFGKIAKKCGLRHVQWRKGQVARLDEGGP